MPISKQRQREVEKPLDELRSVIRHDVRIAAALLGLKPPTNVLRRIEDELFGFANPWCSGFHDSPLPSQRGDLRVEYARQRIADMEGTVPQDLARQIQVTPDAEHPCRGSFRLGDPLPGYPSYGKTFKAFKSVHKRKDRKGT